MLSSRSASVNASPSTYSVEVKGTPPDAAFTGAAAVVYAALALGNFRGVALVKRP